MVCKRPAAKMACKRPASEMLKRPVAAAAAAGTDPELDAPGGVLESEARGAEGPRSEPDAPDGDLESDAPHSAEPGAPEGVLIKSDAPHGAAPVLGVIADAPGLAIAPVPTRYGCSKCRRKPHGCAQCKSWARAGRHNRHFVDGAIVDRS